MWTIILIPDQPHDQKKNKKNNLATAAILIELLDLLLFSPH